MPAQKPRLKWFERNTVFRGSVIEKDDAIYSPFQVCQSAAGYYVGRLAWDKDWEVAKPGSRESDYYPTYESAEEALKSGDFGRDAEENMRLYE